MSSSFVVAYNLRALSTDQHDVKANEPMLKLRHDSRRRIADGSFPKPTMHGGDKASGRRIL
jgi:hypothetical protein